MQGASSRETLLAALVDAVVGTLGFFVFVGGVVVYGRIRNGDDVELADKHEDQADEDQADEDDVSCSDVGGDDDGVDDHDDEPRRNQPATPHELRQALLLRAALFGVRAGLAVNYRHVRSPGFRVVGRRRVDAPTGGPIGVRSVLIGVLFDYARHSATRALLRSRERRTQDRTRPAPELNEIKRKHASHPKVRKHAVMSFHKTSKVSPFAGYTWQVAVPILSEWVGRFATCDGRTVYDRLTGTVVTTA